MPKQLPKKQPNKRPEFQFKGFIEYHLTADEKRFLKEQGVDFERLFDSAEGLSDNGFTFKYSRDNYNSAYQCIVAHSDPENNNAGWFLTGRGSTMPKALRQALYIGEQIGWNFSEWMEGKQKSNEPLDD